jgi:hypothetical protein
MPTSLSPWPGPTAQGARPNPPSAKPLQGRTTSVALDGASPMVRSPAGPPQTSSAPQLGPGGCWKTRRALSHYDAFRNPVLSIFKAPHAG